ncbi:MAG: 4Fe-4S binding protein [Elusimicrobia bacterium]|nr:4Fe-4S binding protein [Elusimicrobiota bacterium]
MKRTIIRIDEEKCNGCGLCVPACHEGAIRIVEGKARLVGESLCDGLGACLGECPMGAIMVEEREAEEYSEKAALENIMAQGPGAVEAHLQHLSDHGQKEYLEEARRLLGEKEGGMQEKPMACGCPGSMTRDMRGAKREGQGVVSVGPRVSRLEQWPVQLKLLNPRAPFFQGADLLVSADCVAFAYADFHERFLKGKAAVVFCPKLDQDIEGYIEKMTEIIRQNEIRSITVVKMEVPCCLGTLKIVEDAVRRSGKNVIIKEYTISLEGAII